MILQLAIRNLRRNTRRTLAILITVAVGGSSLFLFKGFNYGIMNQYRENTVHSRYGHGQINSKGYRETLFEKPWEHWISNWKQVASQLKETPGVIHVFPRVEFFGLLTNGHVTVSGRAQGIEGIEESKFFKTLNVEEGKFFTDEPDGMVIGKGLAKALNLHPGDRVTVLANTIHGSMNGADFTVTGIFHTGAKEFDDTVFRIPLAQALVLLDTDQVESIAVGLDSEMSWPYVVQKVDSHWSELEATPFAVLDKIYYQHSVDWLNSQFGVIQFIILSIVVLGIFNSVSTGIMERKQEIGNLRANGESKKDILVLLTWEGFALGCLGAFLGVSFALLLNSTLLRNGILMPPAPGLTRQYNVFVEFTPLMALGAFMLSALSTLLGSLLATWKVIQMSISESLRSV